MQETNSLNELSGLDTGVLLTLITLGLILFVVPALITLWRLFKKAGEPGWAAIVPLYNTYMMGKIAKKVPVAIGLIAVSLIPGVGGLLAIPLTIALIYFLAKQYNAGVGFWIAYIFLPIVAVFLVNKVQYTGDNAAPAGAFPQQPNAQPVQGQYQVPAQPQYQPPQPGQAPFTPPAQPTPEQPVTPPQNPQPPQAQ